MDQKTISEIATELCLKILKDKPYFIEGGFYLHYSDYLYYFTYKHFDQKIFRKELRNIKKTSFVH